ncbi:MAG: nuclear transport factor 2 family protein [Cellulosilyticum sp.]|nr:nuclear transport factor 2 family protein [Cellulosilyticum sp.]
MKKGIGILVIVAIVGISVVWMTMDRVSNEGDMKQAASGSSKEIDVKKEINQIADELNQEYPTEADQVVEIHNQLMGIAYKYPMDDEAIKSYVETIRELYSNEFKELNPQESQIEALKKEHETMSGEQMELVISEVTEVYVAQNDQGEAIGAEVNVLHATNQGSTVRTYLLTKEDGKWKINGWENEKS